MASPTIDVHCDAPDPGVQPTTFAEACAIIDSLLRADFPGPSDYIPYIKGSTTPATEDQDKVWIQTFNSGAPRAVKIYFNGNWRRISNGKPNEVAIFVGDPSTAFGSTGLGIVGGDWDGWAIMNGLNGTADYSDRFFVGAHMNQASGISQFGGQGWQTGLNGSPEHAGGHAQTHLTQQQTPQPATDPVMVDLFHATGDGRDSSGAMFGKHDGASVAPEAVTLIPSNPGNPNPFPIELAPPFVAVCYCQYLGIT